MRSCGTRHRYFARRHQHPEVDGERVLGRFHSIPGLRQESRGEQDVLGERGGEVSDVCLSASAVNHGGRKGLCSARIYSTRRTDLIRPLLNFPCTALCMQRLGVFLSQSHFCFPGFASVPGLAEVSSKFEEARGLNAHRCKGTSNVILSPCTES